MLKRILSYKFILVSVAVAFFTLVDDDAVLLVQEKDFKLKILLFKNELVDENLAARKLLNVVSE